MGVKIFTVLLFLFVAELTFLATKKPKDLGHKDEIALQTDLSFTQLHGTFITPKGVTRQIHASKAIRYADHETLTDINASYTEGNLTHQVRAGSATHRNHLIAFEDKVFYQNSQDLRLITQRLEYNMSSKVLTSPVAFKLWQKQDTQIEGSTFRYDLLHKKMQAERVHYIQEVKE